MTKEKTIENNIKAFFKKLNDAGVPCHIIKRHGGAYSGGGHPDLEGCIMGRSIQIEVKNETGKTTKLQDQMIKRWKAAGAVVCVARSVEDVKKVLFEQIHLKEDYQFGSNMIDHRDRIFELTGWDIARDWDLLVDT